MARAGGVVAGCIEQAFPSAHWCRAIARLDMRGRYPCTARSHAGRDTSVLDLAHDPLAELVARARARVCEARRFSRRRVPAIPTEARA